MYMTHNRMKYIYENIYINKRTIITVTTIYMFLVLKVRVWDVNRRTFAVVVWEPHYYSESLTAGCD